jgi:hypothetical protein
LARRWRLRRVPFDDMPALLHKDEQVWPAPFADEVRTLLDNVDGSGARGDTYQVTVQALDAKSFGQYLQQPGAATAMVRSIKRLSRARRL